MAIPAAAGQSLVGRSASGPLNTGPVTSGQSGPGQLGAEPDILDDIPEGSEQPPAAEPPPANRQNYNAGPIAADPPADQPLVNPPGGFNHQGGGFGAGRSAGNSATAGAPGALPTTNFSQPIGSTGRDSDSFPSHGQSRFRSTGESEEPPGAEKKTPASTHGAKAAETPALSWPLLLVITVLLPSLGMNLYLGWNLWESYNRRAAPPSPARAHPRHTKPSHQHARHGHEKHSHEGHSDESKSAISR
jgi:hypothetical protein